MADINFRGKTAIEAYYQHIPSYQLKPSPNKGVGSKPDLARDNLIIHGDNLFSLKALLPVYAGKIKCIYIDPPYNTGYEAWAFNDNATTSSHMAWLTSIVGPEVSTYNRHDAWLCMMLPRLRLLHELLADDGVLIMSIDDNEQAHLKMLTDEIFGEENMIGNLVWDSPEEDRDISKNKDLSSEHEYVLVYAKNITAPTLFQGDPRTMPNDLDTSRHQIILRWPYNTGLPSVIGRNIHTADGMAECQEIFGTRIFDYPKPSALLTLLIKQFTHKDSLILDSFAGTGTTGQAVLDLNAQDEGQRRFILIESLPYADTITAERVRRAIKGVPKARNPRLRKGLGGSFSYYNLIEK